MNSYSKTAVVLVIGVLMGVLMGVLIALVMNRAGDDLTTEHADGPKPLYWVAPMDPNYRRDRPGKSPMGMDLLPVYEEAQREPGAVQISPDVVNNLGVRTALVETGRLNPEVKTVGYIQYDENHLANVVPRVEGWIETLYVKAAGEEVNQGDPLYAIYSPELVIAQEELLLAVNQGNTRMIRGAAERLRALKIPDSVIEKIKVSRQVQRSVTIHAPQSGIVDQLEVREGDYVMPSTPIMSIAELDSVWALGEVFERQLPFVERGDPVVMTLDYLPSRRWQGEIDYLYPSIDPTTRTARVRMRFANPDYALKPGMFAQLRIAGDASEETLLIPKEALIRTGDAERVVLALGDGEFKSIHVAIGRIADQQVEILSGLHEGDRVVTSAQFLIDSESSKTSDFVRMNHSADANSESKSVWVAAEVRAVMANHGMVTLHHEPIDQWQWPAMTMDFDLADHLDIGQLREGRELEVEIIRADDGSYQITDVRIPEIEPSADDAQNPNVDHSHHRGMNHD